MITHIATSSSAIGWTSLEAPFFEPVHQEAIARTLDKLLSTDNWLKIPKNKLIELLQKEQNIVDEDQEPKQSHEHSMTGVEKKGQTCSGERTRFIGMTESLLREDLSKSIQLKQDAIQLHDQQKLREAFSLLGKAIHALQDATSPAHEGFQSWRYDETLSSELSHVFQENQYPENQDDSQNIYKSRLEASVRWAYAIFKGETTMPEHFFDTEGRGILLIPQGYLPGPPYSLSSDKCKIEKK